MENEIDMKKVVAAVQLRDARVNRACGEIKSRERLGGTVDESASAWSDREVPQAIGKRKLVRTTQGKRCRSGFMGFQIGF